MSKRWTKFEKLQLRFSYPCLGPTQLARLGWIPNRTKTAIEIKARKLGLKKSQENRVIDNEDGTSWLILDGRDGSERARVLVDTEIVDQLIDIGKWSLLPVEGHLQYAYRRKQGATVTMHRHLIEEVWGERVPDGHHVDHINGDGLDNRRENLRAIPAGMNTSRDKGRRPYAKHDLPRGVTKGNQRKDSTQTYVMQHKLNGRLLRRTFDCPNAAHLAYRLARFTRTEGDVYGDRKFIDDWGEEEWELIRDSYTGKLPD